MKILLTNHQLRHYAGTEVFTYTLAKALKERSHEVWVYSAYIGNIGHLFDRINIPLISDLQKLKEKFDIAHVHHNINAYEVRHYFPTLPIIFMSHGTLPFLEKPPFIDLGISKYLAVSEVVRDNLINSGIPAGDISIVRNLIDENKFYPRSKINIHPQKALIISNKIDKETELNISKACNSLSISCTFVGNRFKTVPNTELPDIIRQHDLIFSLGRGVIETMFCARIPIILDYLGGDGMVTPQNFQELIKNNFSEHNDAKKFSVEDIISEITLYQQENGEKLRNLALEEFSVSKNTDKLIEIYKICSQKEVPALNEVNIKIISEFCQSINVTRYNTRRLLLNEIGGDQIYEYCLKLQIMRAKLFPGGSRRLNLIKRIILRNN